MTMEWPQYVMIAVMMLWIGGDIAKARGWEPEPPSPALLGFRVLFRPVFFGLILHMGGFW